jgi:drug/metabolite transporter (DMT)-like permease
MTNTRSGILYMNVGMLLFTMNDAIGKWLVQDYPVGQLLFIRSIAALIVLAPLIRNRPDIWRSLPPRKSLHLLRMALVVAEVACFYWAVRYIPLADTFMFYLAAPIFVAALSIPLLGEKIGLHRWTAIVVGFMGVIVILGPGQASFSLPALIAVIGSIALALMMLMTRILTQVDGMALITYQTLGVAIAGAATLPFNWVTPSVPDFIFMGGLGLVAMAGHFSINHAFRICEANIVAPFQYTSLIWAFILGYFVWGDIPTWQGWLGSAIIVASGLYIFVREHRQG